MAASLSAALAAAPPRRALLWSPSIANAPLPDRLAAAVIAGFDGLTVSAADARQVRDDGGLPSQWTKRAADQGVELTTLDGISDWYPHEPPRAGWPAATATTEEILDDAAAFGVRTVGALGPFRTQLSISDMAEHFAILCDQAAERGLAVHFEFTPKSPIDDIAKATELVTGAGRENGGILLDTWHFFRVNPDFDALAAVPAGKIFAVQVSDGADHFVENLLGDTFRHRLLPGEGTFELLRVLRALDAMNALQIVGPEVLSEEQYALPLDEAARRVHDAYLHVMDLALSS